MLEERFRVIYLSKDGTGIKQVSFNFKKFLITSVLGLSLCVGVIIFSVGLITRLYQNYRILALKNDREHLQKELLLIKEQVSVLNGRLSEVEQHGDDLRNLASLPSLDNDMRQVGVGGPSVPSAAEMGYAADEVNRTAAEIKMDLEKYERAISLEKSSMEEIETRIRENMDRVDHFPSIRPILGGLVREGYGYRTDPFTKRLAHHDGVDIPMPEGTKVLSCADGIVVEAKTGYIPHKSYGIEVIVDHGYGYKSRYAHLCKVLVYKGQKVKKWDPIGEVGETGRATGSHLHYEVMFEGKNVDPDNYIYN